ncbi:MAG: phosphoglycerate dehydrogenase [Candidatus Omnitrophota bacterium]
MKVFISTSTFAEYDKAPLVLLRKKGITFNLNPHKRKLTEKEISSLLAKGNYGGLLAGTEPLTREVLNNSRTLKVISRVGAGLDNVDMAGAKDLKIKVFNTPDVLTDSVSELTLGLILSCLRRIALTDRNIRKKIWKKEMGMLLKGKTVGLIGFGRIGQRVANLTKAFGAKVIFSDPRKIKSTLGKQVSMDNLLKAADIISIHAASKDALISENEIAKMKQGVILVNTARGSVVTEAALLNGLKSGKVASAGLDVFEPEPYSGELINLDNVVLTAHMGSYAKEARIKMELEAVKNLLKGLTLRK